VSRSINRTIGDPGQVLDWISSCGTGILPVRARTGKMPVPQEKNSIDKQLLVAGSPRIQSPEPFGRPGHNGTKTGDVMKIVCAVIGALFLLLALSALPRLFGLIGQEEDAKVIGRGCFILCEVAIGAGLVYFGIRSRNKRIPEKSSS
jgi:hypothetical protein